jgi:hypothetical protein
MIYNFGLFFGIIAFLFSVLEFIIPNEKIVRLQVIFLWVAFMFLLNK